MHPPSPESIQDLRAESRRLARALGVIRDRVAGVGCTPSQCHALVELSERNTLTTAEFAELMAVDKSTASRTLRPLLAKGLLVRRVDPDDQRSKPLVLSDEGRRAAATIHARADAQVRAALELLRPDEQAAVRRGISLYVDALARAGRLAGLEFRPIEEADDAPVAALIRRVLTEFGVVGEGSSIHDPEVDAMTAAYADARSAYFVVARAEPKGEAGQTLVAVGGIAPLVGGDDDVCELRKMYSLPELRGRGVGRRLLELCLEAARERGFRRCYLETIDAMRSARALYERAGFTALPAPRGCTGHTLCNRWYELEL